MVGLIEKTNQSSVDGCTFVTYDFKDLYTNVLFKDASNTLRELAIILGIARAKVDFLLDIYFAIIGIILMWVIVYLNR